MTENDPRDNEGLDSTENLNATENLSSDQAPTTQVPQVHVEPTPKQSTTQMPYVQAYDTQTGEPLGGAAPVNTETIKHTVVKTKTKKLPVFVASLAGMVVGAVLIIALVMTGALNVGSKSVSTSSGSQTIKIDSEDTTLAEAVSTKCLPSVVSITVATESTSSDLSSMLSGSDSSSSDSSSSSIGSGVVLDTDGNILTNYHVVEDASSITVSMNDESYEAELVGSDSSSDLAVIKLKDCDSSKLTPAEIGDSSALSVGEWVMAIGSPFGNEQSVSTGIVSSLYRSTALSSTSGTAIYANMIQTDAAINPGNSGGALVNSNGELIGINSIIESYSGSSSGVGFAIPSNYAVKIAKQIIAGETPVHPYLGVTLTSVTASNARSANLSVTEGAYISAVTDDSPASEAGLQQGDVVTKVDKTEITSADSLIIALRSYDVGDKVTLTIVRDSKEQTVEVTLGSDEKLQEQQQDTTEGDTSGSGMSRDQLREYLNELLNGGYGSQGQSQ